MHTNKQTNIYKYYIYIYINHIKSYCTSSLCEYVCGGNYNFLGMDFVGLLEGRISTPWTPTVAGSLDTSQFDAEFTSMQPTSASTTAYFVYIYKYVCSHVDYLGLN